MEVHTTGSRHGKPFQATAHRFIANLRTTQTALLELIRDRWSLDSWDWIRDALLREDNHRGGGDAAGVMATLRIAALNLMRVVGLRSVRQGLVSGVHDITTLLAMSSGGHRWQCCRKSLNQPFSPTRTIHHGDLD
ncbi:hypothetical protein EVJ50_00795 [Synechococcus sp. RSCCF101]|uniref:hypothetical protein n=1 Tax=Synechococcus sp. RSCCF101 TaxID=2511069 RepID=UPI00124482D3|nr:hypothetical protein [Synechococcus sp. RSCCF101]QEY31007.1 hypothetical protein EVJ50_00795 [Synechococcus sp. RSCCF101]